MTVTLLLTATDTAAAMARGDSSSRELTTRLLERSTS